MSKSVYIVATPIGNLGDLTFRAVDVLKTVDIILAEDTRRVKILLDHYDIKTKTMSYHMHNEKSRLEIIRRLLLEENKSIALVSDAGTPLISDPGWIFIEYSLSIQIPVIPIPGVSALTTHLSVSGLPTDKVLFLGFLPRKEKEIKTLLGDVLNNEQSVVFFESPNRAITTLEIIKEISPLSDVCIGRELTKIHEEFIRFKAQDMPRDIKTLGEFTIGVRGYKKEIAETANEENIKAAKKVSESLANYLGINGKEAYNILNKIKKEIDNK